MAPKYTMTNDQITVIHESKTYVIRKGTPQFAGMRQAIIDEKWDDIPNHLTVAKSLKEWAKGKFELKGETFYYGKDELPRELNNRIIKMATNGEDPTGLFKFWEKLQKNPSKRSVDSLYPFLQHQHIPITKSGNFLAYKSVKSNFKDHHSGMFDNHPGELHSMPRNMVSDDPRTECHEGFHVGALGYVRGTWSGDKIVVCVVDPADVVCVPYDHSQQKIRVCRYKVKGVYSGEELSSTIHEEDEFDPSEEDDGLAKDTATTPCEECKNEIPDSETSEINDYHKESCSLSAAAVKKDEDKKKAVQEDVKPIKDNSRFAKLDTADLMKESIEDLRKYAGKTLKIVGASKIPGGKAMLVGKIMEVRK